MQTTQAQAVKPHSALKLSLSRTILVGLAFLTCTIFWQTYDYIMPLYLKNFNLSESIIGIIMALDNILALFLLPFMGLLSDKFPMKLRSKFGRRIPFIVVGSILAASTFLLVNLAHNMHNLPLLMVMTAFVLLFMCFYRTPAVSLMPDVTPKILRSKANAVINIMGAVGTVIALALQIVFTKLEDSMLVGNNWIIVCVVSALMIVSTVILIFKVRENKLVEQKIEQLRAAGELEADEDDDTASGKVSRKSALKSLPKAQLKSLIFILASVFLWYVAYNGIGSMLSIFCADVFNQKSSILMIIGNVAAFAMFVPATIIGNKLGRKKAVIMGVLLMIAGLALATILIFALINANPTVGFYLMVPSFMLVGAGWAAINVHSYVMSVEFADSSTTGVYTGLYYTFSMAAQAVTPFLAGLFMQYISPRALIPYALVFTCLALVTMLFVRHGNAKENPPAAEPTSPATDSNDDASAPSDGSAPLENSDEAEGSAPEKENTADGE